MSHLHTVNNPALLPLCLRVAQSGDSLLLIEDGVYSAQRDHDGRIPAGIETYALQIDVEARGIQNRINPSVTAATNSDFVRLCCEHDKIINWF